MAFKELEHRGRWLRSQTAGWLGPCALLSVAFSTYLGSQRFGARTLVLLSGFAGILAAKQSSWMVW